MRPLQVHRFRRQSPGAVESARGTPHPDHQEVEAGSKKSFHIDLDNVLDGAWEMPNEGSSNLCVNQTEKRGKMVKSLKKATCQVAGSYPVELDPALATGQDSGPSKATGHHGKWIGATLQQEGMALPPVAEDQNVKEAFPKGAALLHLPHCSVVL